MLFSILRVILIGFTVLLRLCVRFIFSTTCWRYCLDPCPCVACAYTCEGCYSLFVTANLIFYSKWCEQFPTFLKVGCPKCFVLTSNQYFLFCIFELLFDRFAKSPLYLIERENNTNCLCFITFYLRYRMGVESVAFWTALVAESAGQILHALKHPHEKITVRETFVEQMRVSW